MTTGHDVRLVAEVREADFEPEVLRASQPVLVAFYAPWSRPCHILEAALDEVAATRAGRAKVLKVNADDAPELSIWYDVQSVPTLLFFLGGSLCARLVGTATKEAIIAKLADLRPGSHTGPVGSPAALRCAERPAQPPASDSPP